MIVDAAARHRIESGRDDGLQVAFARGLIALQNQLQGAGVGKLGGVAEAAEADIEIPRGGVQQSTRLKPGRPCQSSGGK
jgi:hypothetical protein